MTSPQANSQISSIEDLIGPAGRLEAVLNTGREDAAYAALVCHPYPLAGGTLHNKVVYNAMKVFSSLGLPVLRFNFRGVGLSEGDFDHGHGEQDDVRAALDWLECNLRLPILFAGFSFGSYVGFRACGGDPRVKALIALGLPVSAAGRNYSYEFLAQCTQPKLFLSGDHDQFGPVEVLDTIVKQAPEPKHSAWIEGAEHFFQGIPGSPAAKLPLMQQEMRNWLKQQFQLKEEGSS